jgi:hypothetical protein
VFSYYFRSLFHEKLIDPTMIAIYSGNLWIYLMSGFFGYNVMPCSNRIKMSIT